MKSYYIYMLTNRTNKVLYIGMTNHLERRISEHRCKQVPGFTHRYNLTKLVYYEEGVSAKDAIRREKELKKWRREKKNRLVETLNPGWKDLAHDW